MHSPRSRIAWQLAVALAVILMLVISASTLFALHSLDSANLQTREQHLQSEARLLADQLETFHGSLRDSTQRLAGLFEQRFGRGLSVNAGERIAAGSLQAPALYLEGERLNNNFSQVDEFRTMTGGVATVFVRDGDEFVRITTSVLKQDGSRAIGTVLDHTHPAYARLVAGNNYVGRALLFERNYMTQYTPVKDGSGRVIAVLFVGFDYTDAQKAQFANLEQFRIGKTGSLAVLDERSAWLVAPSGLRGEADVAALSANPGRGAFWRDAEQEYFSVAVPFAGGPWLVLASLPKAEISEVTWQVGVRLVVGSLVALSVAVLLVVWLLRRRLRPLAALVTQARALGAGDLQARMAVDSDDEIGELAASFNQMGEALSTMVSRIRQAAQQVSSGAQNLSGLSSGAYEGVEQQSGEITSMAGAVEEFSATSSNIADNMRETERMANGSAQQTRIGEAAMAEASAAIEQVAGSLTGTAAVVNTLGQRSQEIGGIVAVITAIADQTNLLALNAAIEAARAGEQGRGFAVVADEVRSLASRTRQATTEISAMIGSIQGETSSAIQAIDKGNLLMRDGLERNAKVVAALAEIAAQTRQAGEQFAVITTAAEEQSSTATVLSRNLQSIAQANGEQRQVVADLAQTARQLEGLAKELWNEVDRFR
ncbi:methyl-accepting chemotaxis protein [Stutzerimonas nosocomialis]|uniref:Methyl-accepting chemotaxis protein n=1 Tax=Stutzerimonas nosocomialis TaxID=1056496 RepID=A0A5R9QHY6_9GAMM|nr:methyl-accepting chemotaxis protein [Stutzerimonas nosocomialis]TLX64841.1 methyl-accepting chemotaxis protein [Stutzerimonas nosocomialis]